MTDELRDSFDQVKGAIGGNVSKGRVGKFAQPGQIVRVFLPGSKRPVKAKAATVINSSSVVVVQDDKGQAYAYSESAPNPRRSSTGKFFKSRPVGTPSNGNIKYVLLKNTSGQQSVYVCGHQTQCVKVFDVPLGSSDVLATIDNIGADDWILTVVLNSSTTATPNRYRVYRKTQLVKELILPVGRNYDPSDGTLVDFAVLGSFGDAQYSTPLTVYPVGFGKFVANITFDDTAEVIEIPPIDEGGSPTYIVSNAFRGKLDLYSSQTEFAKATHPSITYELFNLDETINDWASLDGWGTYTELKPISFNRVDALTYAFQSHEVFRMNRDGTKALHVGLLETSDVFAVYLALFQNNTDGRIYTEDDREPSGYNLPLQRLAFDIIGLSGTEESFFQRRALDFTPSGLNVIEIGNPNSIISVTPLTPEQIESTLFEIERNTEIKQVTVWALDNNFTVKTAYLVNVFPPNINIGETSNYGTVLAASYFDPTQPPIQI